jgi:hypothetical protein
LEAFNEDLQLGRLSLGSHGVHKVGCRKSDATGRRAGCPFKSNEPGRVKGERKRFPR